ncbi:SMI1/KNR4 family protein [Streptomyces sp. JJ36]|uniref:SMI1/KNR4 family protein n=1 Tax=Streptomyces sp. JJ36 TaxID=2736645 RepID=UPI001F3D2AB6|nr:SMI1/KNR4 family protein [Streptomyces sp. JJ36]MCF6525021.1 SMI1/KNR4 family protein [Streptomyces sp. JJ36]
MDLTRLTALLGLPRPGDRPVAVDWSRVESWLGLTLPGDYKALFSGHGPLDIGEFVWLHGPCVQEARFDYTRWLRETHRSCRIASREAPPYEPPALHPETGGLLAWGETRAESVLFWDTGANDDPDRWPVVLHDPDSARAGRNPWQRYDHTLTETLAALLTSGLELPGGGRLGPLPATARRTAFLPEPAPWAPPETEPEAVRAERRAALTEGTDLAALTRLVPPPASPYLGTGRTWDELYEALGTRLPAEYVALMERYGAGCWAEWLRFFEPLGAGDAGLVEEVEWRLDTYRELRAEFPEFNPLATWPEPGGFLPFADSIDGDQLGWLTEGDPERWQLIVHPRHADQGPPLSGGLVDTLLEWSRGRLRAEGLPGLDAADDPLDFVRFQPWGDSEG